MVHLNKMTPTNIIYEAEYKELPIFHLEFCQLGRDDWQSFPVVLSTESSRSLFDEIFADSLNINVAECDQDFFNETSYRKFPVICRLPNEENIALMAYINHAEKVNKMSCSDLTSKVGIILDSSKIFFFN